MDISRDTTHLSVHDLPQFFVDNLVIEQVQNVTRRWYQPVRAGDEPILKRDRPWEHVTYFSYSNYAVLRDPTDGLIKCWYEDLDMIPGVYPALISHRARQLYAYSEDGVNFVKPELDRYTVDGQKTNIVLGDDDYGWVHSASYIVDPHPPSPDHHVRTIYSRQWEDKQGGKHERIECAHSPDGIHWTVDEQAPRFGVSGSQLNDVCVLSYDHDARQFINNTRHPLMWSASRHAGNPTSQSFGPVHSPDQWYAHGRRRIWQSRSSDFAHWSEPLLIVAPDDDQDNLDDTRYGMSQMRVGMTWFAFCGVLHTVDNTRDVILLVSHDGVRWQNTNHTQPFMAPRGHGYWDGYMQSICSPPIEMGDELWFYHGGSACSHDLWMCDTEPMLQPHPELQDPSLVDYSLGLAKLRKDGFASLDTCRWREGIVTTRPMCSSGTKLIINARCRPGGSIQVEVVDRGDNIVGACTRENCDPFTGDAVAHTMTWADDPQVATTDDHYRKLRVFLRDAEIFSFRFDDVEQTG